MSVSSLWFRSSRAVLTSVLFVATLAAPALAGQAGAPAAETKPPADAVRLDPKTPVERELAPAGADWYALDLTSGQYAYVEAEQRGIDVVLDVVAPSGKTIAEVDSPNGTQGPEGAIFVTDETGAYRFGVRSLDATAPAGRYQFRVVELRAATPKDAPLIEATGLYNQSIVLTAQGHYKEAVAPAERAIEIREKTVGPDDPIVADALEQLGLVRLWLADIAAAEPAYSRALAIREKALGPDHPDTGRAVYRLAALYLNKGDYAKAEAFYRRTLANREKAFGPEASETGDVLSELGYLYQVQNDVVRAEPIYRRALSIQEKTRGPNDSSTAFAVMNVAWVALNKGDYPAAQSLYERALAIRMKAKDLGPNHPDTAEPLRFLAVIRQNLGDYDEAIELDERALAIDEKALGPDHPNTANLVGDLAELYVKRKDFAKAESYYLRSLASNEKTLGPDHPFVAQNLVFLAFFYNETAQYAKAEPPLRRALAVYEKALGPESLLSAAALNNLAFTYCHTSRTDEARPLYERALAIYEKSYGPDHPKVGFELASLTGLEARTGDVAAAIRSFARSADISERNIDANLATGSERQKLQYLSTLASETDVAVSLSARFAPDDPAARRLALLTVLRRKGRALDAMADSVSALRGRLDPGDRDLLDRLTDTRARLSALVLRGPGRGDPAAYRAELKDLADRADRLEADVSARSSAFRAQSMPVTIEAVRAAIPADAALVEFVRYRVESGQYTTREKEWDPPHYAAYVLRRDGEPASVDLGDAATIDKASDALRDALRDPKRTDAKALARALDERVMRPVRALLGPTRRALLSPDGELNLVPFAALVDESDRYLVERYSFTYLTSGRDLLRLGVRPDASRGTVIFADPAFGGRATPGSERKLVIEETTAGATPKLYFGPLPGTAAEARSILAILPDATVLTKDAATETALKGIRAPEVLHVATHGFFLKDANADPERAGNPLLRAGLGLAGANLRAEGGDDGVLTALEAASLDLWGTKLVVLSACDTGVGEVRNGDGVYGLRRALVLAGSESQVMSLWPVSDQGTRELMTGYYRGLESGEGRGEALRRVQLRLLKSPARRHPYYWASFIESGAWEPLGDDRVTAKPE